MISIIVPVYNVEPYLNQCLDSIINQTYKDIEIILIDDGSSDHCGEICEKYAKEDPRIRVFHTVNNGLSAARNLGLKETRGEFVGFVDSDDWIEPNMYEVLHEKAFEFNADICECNFWFGTSPSNYIDLEDTVYRANESLTALFNNRICHVVWNKIYKKELFDSVSFPEGRNIEDISIMHLLIGKTDTVVTISDKKYHYRQRADSIRYTYSASNLIDYADAFLERYKFYKQHREVLCTVKEEEQLLLAASGVSRVWRWWFGCSKKERIKFKNRITEFVRFSKGNIPLFGCSSWPVSLKISSFFMHSDSLVSFMSLYYLNQLFRFLNPSKSSVID